MTGHGEGRVSGRDACRRELIIFFEIRSAIIIMNRLKKQEK